MARAQKVKPIINDESIAKHPFAKEGEVILRDNVLPGFCCRIGKRSKTFSIRYERRLNGVRLGMKSKTLGKYGVKGYTAAQARIDAETERGKGHAGTMTSKSGTKIADILPGYKRQTVKQRAKRDNTLLAYDNSMKRLKEHAPEVLASTIRQLIEDPRVMEDAIEVIVKQCGQASANQTIRFVRGITLFAKRDRSLALPPGHPCETVSIIENDETGDSLSPRELKVWWGHQALVTDPILKAQWEFTALSGIRKSEVQTLRWQDFDYAERRIRAWDPKGGPRLAFDVVLSRPAIRALMRARAAGRRLYPKEAKTWCFPGDTRKPEKWAGTNCIRDAIIDVTSHDLRRTWAALAKSYCSVSVEDVDRMQNRGGKTVGDRRYIRSGVMGPHYLDIAERVSAFLLSKRPSCG